jgi:hypothetical protein
MEATEQLKIQLDGCDDGTTVEGYWTPAEATTLIEFANFVNANATYGCQVNAVVHHNGEKVVGE